VSIYFVLGRFKKLTVVLRIGGGDVLGFHYPDANTFAASGVDVASVLECHCFIRSVEATEVTVFEAILATNENFP
jgi:hypothetical protein